MSDTVGARFGRLVKEKRQNWTQAYLAGLAFGDEKLKSQICRLERGRIPNPHEGTMVALAKVLGITPEQRARCEMPDDPELPRLLLENLAMRFEAENPDAPAAELAQFLKAKAREWRALKDRLAALEQADVRLADSRAAAEGAVAHAEYDAAEAALQAAEDLQQAERTLAEVRKQADIRKSRAEVALLKGDADRAAEHFRAAADFLAPFDVGESTSVRDAAAKCLCQYSQQFGKAGLLHAIEFYRENAAILTRDIYPIDWATTQNCIGGVLCDQSARVEGAAGASLLDEAVAHHTAALEIFTPAEHPLEWGQTQNYLAIALWTQAERAEEAAGTTFLEGAVRAYRAALEVTSRETQAWEWAAIQSNLGIALMNQAARSDGESALDRHKLAASALRSALEVRTRTRDEKAWATLQSNLAVALNHLAARVQGEEALSLLRESVCAYEAVLEVRTPARHRVDWALTQNNLAIALWSQAKRVDDSMAGPLLERAVAAYRGCLSVYTREAHPLGWAGTHMNLSAALETMGNRGVGDPAERYQAAIGEVDLALGVFSIDAFGPYHGQAVELRDRLAKKLADLESGSGPAEGGAVTPLPAEHTASG